MKKSIFQQYDNNTTPHRNIYCSIFGNISILVTGSTERITDRITW